MKASADATPKRRSSVLFKLMFSLLLTLGLTEGCIRLFEAWTAKDYRIEAGTGDRLSEALYRPHPYVGYVLRPGAGTPPGQPWSYEVNAAGFRGEDFDEQAPPRTFRVACLGGSTTWGTGASDTASTWPAQLKGMLEQLLPPDSAYDRVEVINAGVSGYSIMESFVNFKMRVAPLQPDLVIVYHAINDARVIGRAGFKPDYTHVRRSFTVPIPSALDGLFGWSHLYGLLWSVFGGERGTIYDYVYTDVPERLPLAERADIGVANYARSLAELVAVARVNGCEIVLTTFGYSRSKVISDRKKWMQLYGFDLVDQLNAETREVAKHQRAMLVPVGTRLAKDASLFVDPVHLTDEGNRVLAMELAVAVARSGLLAGPAEPRGIRPIERSR